MENPNTLTKTKNVWVIVIYFILCFYCFGITLMNHYVEYISLSKIHQNIEPVMNIFKNRMILASYIPSVLLVFASIYLYRLHLNYFSKKLIITTILVSTLSTLALLIFILPIHNALPISGLTEAVQNELYPKSFNLQVIPGVVNVIIALLLLNSLLKETKSIPRIIFMLVVGLTFYAMGTSVVEAYINYPSWTKIAEADWLGYRFSGNKFAEVFLFPNFLPLLLIIPLFWRRPSGIPKSYVITFLLAQLYIFIVTAIYFVPKIQIPLNTNYSLKLIEDLSKYDLIFRVPAILLLLYITVKMLMKTEKIKVKEI